MKKLYKNLSAPDKELLRTAVGYSKIEFDRSSSNDLFLRNLQNRDRLKEIIANLNSNNRGIPRPEIESILESMREDLTSESEEPEINLKISDLTSKDGINVKSPTEKFDWAPFPSIPNCKDFSIKTNGFDEILGMFGLDKRKKPKIVIEKYSNANFIHYAQRMIVHLRRKELSEKQYGGLAYKLMARSRVFQLMAISKNFPRYHRDMPLKTIMGIMEEITELCRNRDGDLKSKRVGIPKPSKIDPETGKTIEKFRPLGVPTPTWRVALSLMNFFLVTRYQHLIPEWQHAYVPHKGALTAWKVVLEKVIKSKYIYEFDIKGFFDNVPIAIPCNILKSEGCPTGVTEGIVAMARTAPELDKSDSKTLKDYGALAKEGYVEKISKFRDMYDLLSDLGERVSAGESPSGITRDSKGNVRVTGKYGMSEGKITFKSDESYTGGRIIEPTKTYEEHLVTVADKPGESLSNLTGRRGENLVAQSVFEMDREGYIKITISKKDGIDKSAGVQEAEERINLRNRGFPQGAPISAFLSILALKDLETPKTNILMYADDGILYSDEPIDVEGFARSLEKCGVQIARDKSSGVRGGTIINSWKRNLKFLGLKYLGETDQIMSDTRNGARHKFNLEGVVKAEKLYKLGIPVSILSKLESWDKSTAGQMISSITASIGGMKRKSGEILSGYREMWVNPPKPEHIIFRRGSKEEGIEYFMRLLSGRVKGGEIESISLRSNESLNDIKERLYDNQSMKAGREGKIEKLRTRVGYLITQVPGDLGSKVNQILEKGISGEDTLNSRLGGGFISKMQYKGFVNEVPSQNFMLGWKSGTSWCAKRCRYEGIKYRRYNSGLSFDGMPVDFANSTSFAFRDIIEQYRVREKSEMYKQFYLNGDLTLKELNSLRKKIGRPKISGTYVRRIKLPKVVEPPLVGMPILDAIIEKLSIGGIRESQLGSVNLEVGKPNRARLKRVARLLRTNQMSTGEAIMKAYSTGSQRRSYHYGNEKRLIIDGLAELKQSIGGRTKIGGARIEIELFVLVSLCIGLIGTMLETESTGEMEEIFEIKEESLRKNGYYPVILLMMTIVIILSGMGLNGPGGESGSGEIQLSLLTGMEIESIVDNPNLTRGTDKSEIAPASPILMHGYGE